MGYFDLTQTFKNTMPVYPGDVAPELIQIAELSKDDSVDHQIKTAMHVGTHMDGPMHMVAGGNYLSEIPVERFFGRGRLIDVREKPVIQESVLEGKGIAEGDIVLFFSGFSQYFGEAKYYAEYPELSEGCARKLVELKVKMVGFDSPSPDRGPYAVHKILLGEGILILENLCNFESLVGMEEFEVVALPAKWQTDSAAVRVVVQGA